MRKIDRKFFKAIRDGSSLGEIKELISEGANVRAKNHKAVKLCVETNQPETLKYLLENGGDANVCNMELIANCMLRHHDDVFDVLVDFGYNVRKDNDAILQWATNCGTERMLFRALGGGMNVESHNGAALRTAVRRKEAKKTAMLLRAGAKRRDINLEELFI